MATQAQLAAVQQLYVGYLGRAADSAGQQFWANAIANGTATIASVATGFTLSAEYKAAYGGLTTDALVEKVYNNVLGRTPDAEGKAFWVAALASGKVTADTLVATIVTNLGALDQQTINNKVFVAQTYTDTVGADYAPAGGAAVLVGVDSTPASVNTALAAITGGTLPGQVPGLALINGVAAAEAALTAYETSNTPAVDALVAKLAATNFNTNTKALTAASTYDDKLAAIKADAALATAAKAGSTTVLTALAKDASDKVAADKAALTLNADKNLVAVYDSAVAANAALKASSPADVGAAVGGLAGDAGFAAALAAAKLVVGITLPAPITDAASLYAAYVAATTTADQRTALDTALKGDAYASAASFKATAAADIAKNAAVAAEATAKINVDGNANTATYSADVKASTDAAALVTAAQAADANQTAADGIAKAQATEEAKVTAANTAISDFNKANTGSQILDQSKIAAAAADTVKDTFYFNHKVTGADDFIFGSKAFAAGDSIVLDHSLTYNSGALSTGNNNSAEFFLIQGKNGVQVVIESTVAGSTNATTAADGTVTTTGGATDTTAVITLTGVNVADLTVSNGVISHV